MNILCVIDSLGSGGAQRQLVELAKGFKEKGHIVSFLTYHDLNFFKPELDKFEIPVTTFIQTNYLKRLLGMRRIIRNAKPDAVLSFLEASNFIATVAGFPSKNWKLVVGERSANPHILRSIKLRAYRWFHLFTDYVVANSHANLELVQKANPLLPKKKQKVIYNMVGIQSEADKYRESLTTRIVVAASYRKVKNLDGLIKAIHLLPNEYKEKVQIEWYGNIGTEKLYYQKMRRLLENYDLQEIITLNSKTSDIIAKYQEADFVGLFSHYEGFPNSLCEAMALAKPVIVSEVSDVALFIKEGENGFICDSTSPLSIQSSLIKAIETDEKKRRQMGRNNYKTASEEFNTSIIVQKYLDLFVYEKE